jgi:ABC-2 type transport system ATP-binding protein
MSSAPTPTMATRNGAGPDLSADTAGVAVQDLRKGYGRTDALRGVTFDVRRGEIFALLGPNGAGKTTMIEILEGYRRRTSGEAHVLGADPGRPTRSWRERIGLVLQECELDPNLTVRETVRLFSSFYPAPAPVEDTIELAGLAGVGDVRVGRLSGGQRRRVDVAVGIAGDPELIFLDEPTTGFDPTARRAAWTMIDGLRGLGKTILLTTHYMDEAQRLADRIGILREGELVAIGSVEEIGAGLRTDALIHFRLPDGFAPHHIAAEAALPVEMEGDLVTIHAADPQAALYRLTSWATHEGVQLAGLEVIRPTLEDIFLELTAQETEHE